MGEWGVGTDAVSALDCGASTCRVSKACSSPRVHIAHGADARRLRGHGRLVSAAFSRRQRHHRAPLVRDLIPETFTGRTNRRVPASTLVTARADYSGLDRAGAPLRLRLSSTVVRARHLGDPKSAAEVEVTYLRSGGAFKARARGVCSRATT